MSRPRSQRRTRDPLARASKRLSWLLRHGACERRLEMDEAGWAPLDDVLRATQLSREELDLVVAQNNKARFEVQNGRIRATQGHSLAGCPVTVEALEASWEVYTGEESAFHGTQLENLSAIGFEGLLRAGRSHVHLASSRDSHVGKRARVDVLLEVSCERMRAAGHELFVSPNGVVLARQVPPECIVGVTPVSRRAQSLPPETLTAQLANACRRPAG